jgi:tetratricopeptide (TPR) repeat protein
MNPRIACLLAVLAWSGTATAVDIKQSTVGPCSPAINGSNNTVNCPGVDPRAMKWLLDELDTQKFNLKQKTDEANEWVRKYNELNARLTEARWRATAEGEDATLVQTAQDLLHQGKLDEARKIYDRLIASDEANVDRSAQHRFARATIFALQFHMIEALPDYAEAYRLRPKNPRYASDYGGAAYGERQYVEAERGWTAALQFYRDLAAHDPGAYRPHVAMMLNNLGNLYSDTGRLADADKAYSEALTIYNDLAVHDHDSDDYGLNVASTLNNLGTLYRDTGRLADADAVYSATLIVYRGLAAHNPGAYQPEIATALNNLGAVYGDTSRFADADKAFSEALTIRRDLAAHEPGAYRPEVATTLTNLGTLYRITGRRADADKAFSEALTIYRDLLPNNPAYASMIASLTKQLAELRGKSSSSPHPNLAPPLAASLHKS